MPGNAIMFMRDNPLVTKDENKSAKFPRDHFYKTALHLNVTGCVVDSSGKILVMLLKNAVPEHLIQLAEKTTSKHMAQAQLYASIADIRGNRIAANFGSYVEQGGSGKTWTKKSYEWCPGFLEDIHELGIFVDRQFSDICVEIADCLQHVPAEIKLWDSISQLFWNGSSISKKHVDFKDLDYSIVLPFGNFTDSWVDLPYLNTYVHAARGDLYLLHSPKVYHTLHNPDPKRQSFVFTNHNCVVQRYVVVDISNLYSDIYKDQ